MFQQLQTSSTPPSSTVTLARTGNPTAFLSSSSYPTWIIDSGAFDHMIRAKSITFSLDSTCFFPSVTLANDSPFSVQGTGLIMLHFLLFCFSITYG